MPGVAPLVQVIAGVVMFSPCVTLRLLCTLPFLSFRLHVIVTDDELLVEPQLAAVLTVLPAHFIGKGEVLYLVPLHKMLSK
jgi:hypothetical protein